jgi:hypothetical protein
VSNKSSPTLQRNAGSLIKLEKTFLAGNMRDADIRKVLPNKTSQLPSFVAGWKQIREELNSPAFSLESCYCRQHLGRQRVAKDLFFRPSKLQQMRLCPISGAVIIGLSCDNKPLRTIAFSSHIPFPPHWKTTVE